MDPKRTGRTHPCAPPSFPQPANLLRLATDNLILCGDKVLPQNWLPAMQVRSVQADGSPEEGVGGVLFRAGGLRQHVTEWHRRQAAALLSLTNTSTRRTSCAFLVAMAMSTPS